MIVLIAYSSDQSARLVGTALNDLSTRKGFARALTTINTFQREREILDNLATFHWTKQDPIKSIFTDSLQVDLDWCIAHLTITARKCIPHPQEDHAQDQPSEIRPDVVHRL